ncbi:SDR family oxidoreductase [Mycobacterium sp. IS-3022]|uniref:SDR family oxidoreductase n=1 Tax=Mycobacterium sp. IS-3022 TaxID=1772277 RepID=UPI000741752F|nr:SDR family oxidoreductase [Mycobacterium sp. IS-3022]KUI04768.1 ABC transporter permease [Mycobacterium sp. IS-3022]
MAASTVVVGPADGLTRELADRLGGVVVAPDSELPSDLTGAVIVAGPPAKSVEAAGLSGDDWHRLVDEPMWHTLAALQRARSAFGKDGGRIVVVVPTIGMAGAAGLVAYTTAVEGIRAMTKSSARQWASHGVGVNLVAVPLSMFSDDGDAAHLTVAAVAADSTLIRTVAESVAFLLRADLKHLAGETIVADGGSVMLP